MSNNSNESFIGYCRLHSETPRGLFHKKDVARILDLAGEESLAKLYRESLQDFFAVHDNEMHPLCDQAVKNLEAREKEAKKKLIADRQREDEEVLFEMPKGG